jgi:hypothetical protein
MHDTYCFQYGKQWGISLKNTIIPIPSLAKKTALAVSLAAEKRRR